MSADDASHALSFRRTSGGSLPRTGRLDTPHGSIPTPAFLAVATQAAVPYTSPDDLEAARTPALLVNALYLALRPGVELIAEVAGGLHRFMGWRHPILTASGSFQLRVRGQAAHGPVAERIDDAGATIFSHVDGSRHRWSPEASVQAQSRLGADVALALTVQTGVGEDDRGLRGAVDRSLAWNERSLQALVRLREAGAAPALFAVVQGGGSVEERRRCARSLAGMPFDGFAIGGRFGDVEPQGAHEVLRAALGLLPEDRPRHVLIANSLADVLRSVEAGADLVSGAFPTRLAARGVVLTPDGGQFSIADPAHTEERTPPVDDCPCTLCATFSRGYLHHLFAVDEMLGPRLLGIHNLLTIQRAIGATLR